MGAASLGLAPDEACGRAATLGRGSRSRLGPDHEGGPNCAKFRPGVRGTRSGAGALEIRGPQVRMAQIERGFTLPERSRDRPCYSPPWASRAQDGGDG